MFSRNPLGDDGRPPGPAGDSSTRPVDPAGVRVPEDLPEAVVVRARIGVVLPSVNTVVEPWFSATVPAGVAVHATRMLLEDPVTPASLRAMDEREGLSSAIRLASCRPDAIAYGCTASSVVQGLAYDAHLEADLARATKRPCITAVGAIIGALRAVGARTIAMASPYTDAIDHAEHAFFAEAGFTVAGTANLGIADGFLLAAPTPAQMFALASRALARPADALVLSCLNMHAHTVAQALERAYGIPVVTSTTATLWKLLRMTGVSDPIPGYGTLLASH